MTRSCSFLLKQTGKRSYSHIAHGNRKKGKKTLNYTPIKTIDHIHTKIKGKTELKAQLASYVIGVSPKKIIHSMLKTSPILQSNLVYRLKHTIIITETHAKKLLFQDKLGTTTNSI